MSACVCEHGIYLHAKKGGGVGPCHQPDCDCPEWRSPHIDYDEADRQEAEHQRWLREDPLGREVAASRARVEREKRREKRHVLPFARQKTGDVQVTAHDRDGRPVRAYTRKKGR